MKNFFRGIVFTSILFIAGIGLYYHQSDTCAAAGGLLAAWGMTEVFYETTS